jgi:L-ascorbate metabolism protein UlaG (beta-lactamase superfamily)
MPSTLTWHGHSAFSLATGGKQILLDPWLSENPAGTADPATIAADVIVVSHGHGDHLGDAVAIAKRTGALVISNYEVSLYLEKNGVKNTHAMHIGGRHRFDFGTIKLTIAHHGSVLPDGSNGGNPCGVVLTLDDGVIYFAGDTGLFLDMQLIGEAGIDLAIVPIGDNYTMGPEDSVRALQFLEARYALPCHYNTWPDIAQDPHEWARMVRDVDAGTPFVLAPGESVRLERGKVTAAQPG